MRKLKTEELNRVSAEQFREKAASNLVVVLDNIRSMSNVGAAFRTGDAFAIDKLFLCGITACPPHREINKTALGAQETVDWQHFEHTHDALTQLKTDGYLIIVLEQTDKSVSLADYTIEANKKYALVVGNEVFGISDESLPLADHAVEIPQYGTKHSLNVAVALGIALWTFVK